MNLELWHVNKNQTKAKRDSRAHVFISSKNNKPSRKQSRPKYPMGIAKDNTHVNKIHIIVKNMHSLG